MRVITFFGREFTGTRMLAEKAGEVLGYRVVYDRDLIRTAASQYQLEKKEIRRAIYQDPPVADRYTASKARCIAAVKKVLAQEVEKGQVIFSGFLGELIPPQGGLHILVTAPENFRRNRIGKTSGVAEDSPKRMQRADQAFLRWSFYLKNAEHHRPMAYDGVVNVSRTGQDELIEVISRAAAEKEETMSPAEFVLAADVAGLMARKGHPVAVDVHGHKVDITVNKPVLMFTRYAAKLSALAHSVAGVEKVETHAGGWFYRADIYRNCSFTPSPEVCYHPIEMQYEQLYAQVADRKPAFFHAPETLQARNTIRA